MADSILTPVSHAASSSLSDRLQEVTEQLAAARTPDEVFRVVLTPALEALKAVAGAVLVVDEGQKTLTLAATQGYEAGAQTLWQDGPLDETVPAGDALKRREGLFFEHPGELVRAYPELETRTGGVAAVATAVLPMFLDERPLGTIILDFREPHTFTQDERRFLRTLAAQCAVALGRARLMTDLQRQVQERSGQLETDARAHEAFMAFTEAVGTETDLLALARQAIRVLRARFQDGSIGYYTPDGGLWQARAWSEDMDGALVARLRAGLSRDTPFIRDALLTGTPVFTDAWNPGREGIAHSEAYGAAVAYPLSVGGEVRYLLVCGLRGTPRWSERDRALVRAVGRGLTLALERAEQARLLQIRGEALEARTLALERFADLARRPESDPLTLVRQAQEAVSELIGEGFAVYYELDAGVWRLRSQVGRPEDGVMQASLESALPYETVLNFRRPWESGAPFYQDVYDPALDPGVLGTESLASTVALPLVVGGRRQGMFGYGLEVSRPWSRADRATVETAVTSLGLVLERAEQARALEEERAALQAFVAYSEATGSETAVPALAGQALAVLAGRFPGCSSGYYDLEGDRWKLRVHTDDLNDQPELRAALMAGLPVDTPSFAQVLATGAPVFVDDWNPARGRVELTEAYGMVAHYPLALSGEVRAILSLALRHRQQWVERDRAVFRAVGRGLTLTLERAEQARRLQARGDEEVRRRQTLEAFAELSRDLALEPDPLTLVRRAQEVVQGLLPPGFSGYYEPEDGLWRIRSQVGLANTPELQAILDTGLPFEATTNLLIPWRSGVAHYQNEYDPDLDGLTGSEAYPGASVTIPIVVDGQMRGVLGFAPYTARVWSGEDRAVLDTVGRQLSLALERAQRVADLAQRTHELERSNAELEQFAYIASHDLQAPIRAVSSFSEILENRYGDQLDERGRRYLRFIAESGQHMKRLVDDLLTFSRIATEQRPPTPTDSGAVVEQVWRRLMPEVEALEATVTFHALPRVLVDRRQLDQLLQNLLGNALKYHRPGVLPRLQVSAERDGACWRFAVSDNGLGIEGQYFEKIFVIFQRLHGQRVYQGTGIGLAVCKKIVERHGGRLWVESTLGEGSTFLFTLPAA